MHYTQIPTQIFLSERALPLQRYLFINNGRKNVKGYKESARRGMQKTQAREKDDFQERV